MSYKNQVPLCGHVKTNGAQCKSPALRHSYYCYFHERLHDRHKQYRRTEASKAYLLPGVHIQLHALEDAESVQLAISMVVNALAIGALEPKRATPLLYGLQLASINLVVCRLSPNRTISFATSPRPPTGSIVPAITTPSPSSPPPHPHPCNARPPQPEPSPSLQVSMMTTIRRINLVTEANDLSSTALRSNLKCETIDLWQIVPVVQRPQS